MLDEREPYEVDSVVGEGQVEEQMKKG